MKTEIKMPKLISEAFWTLMNCSRPPRPSPVSYSLSNEITTAAPNSSNTTETVVDVGIPIELKKSSKRISVIRTARKMMMISSKKKSSGLKIPFLATSMRPEENTAPTNTPRPATIRIVRMGTALEPMAEFKKFTASLLTPTTKSAMAKRNKRTIREIYSVSIPKNQPQKCCFSSI